MRISCSCWIALLLAAPLGVRAGATDPAGAEFFETRVRPVLVEHCYPCHSVAAPKLKAGLRLDSRAGLVAGGESGPAILPGKPEESRLVAAIRYSNSDLQMPPKGRLTDPQIADLTRWVEAGAPWPDENRTAAAAPQQGFDLARRKAAHWAWRPIRTQPPPPVRHAAWVKDPIDQFILAKLEEQKLAPAPPADRHTLIRRVSFDLIGLPPNPEEVHGFVADESPDAFAKVVDHLLASPAFGERWARHWLDLVRYAETRGHEFDYEIPNAFAYRDYVIRALNADVPYDQFLTEHIAGDLLEPPRRDPTGRINESVLGTGFWFLNEWVHSPVDIRQDETDRIDNQIDVMTKTFLGLTVACARCHDHKFDAIASRDYYGLAGFLESSSLRDVRYEWQEQNCRIVDRMRAMDEAARPAILAALAEALRPALDRAADYLMAARDLMRPGAADASELSSRMDAAATAGRLDRGLLLRWVEEIQRAAEQPLDPLHPWAVLAQDRGPEDPARLARLLGPVLEAWQADATRGRVLSAQLGRGTRNRGGASVLPAVDSPPGALPVPSPGEGAGQVHAAADAPAGGAETTSHASLVVDYARLAPQDWLTDGLAFGYRPTHAGQVLLGTSADRPVTVLCDEAVAHSGTVSTALPGMLRTPTFTIRAPAVWSRVSGSGQAFLVVDSHRMIAGPLHGGTKKAVKAGDAWSWLAHDTRDYIGQRAHIEFTAGDPNGFIAVAAVLQSETAPPAPAESSALVRATLSDPAAQSAQEIARRYERVLLEALDRLAHDRLAEGPDAAERARVAGWLVERCHRLGDSAALHARLDSLMERYAHDRAGLVAELHPSATALAMLDANGVDEHVLIRGNPKNRGEAVPRRYLEAIGGVASAPAGHGSGRLELARHMTDPGDPLVARVIVNRIWHHLFGRGIVASVDNFGALGQPPTHPELLDHLAARFVADGWSIKKMVRAIVLSSVYQQSSAGDAMAAAAVTSATAGTAKQTRVEPGSSAPAADPQNLLLQHMPIRRLEGEAIRDAIVAISGRLDRTMYGPGVEVHLTPFMEGRGRPHESGPLDGAGRRSIYIRVRRNFLAPMMLAFDTPIPFNTVGRRSVSNVPAQALILLNDPLAIEQARVWARGVLAAPGLTPPERITRMYLAAYARPPRASELADALAFLEHQGRELGVPPGAWSDDARVWADLAHVLFNVKEFIFIR